MYIVGNDFISTQVLTAQCKIELMKDFYDNYKFILTILVTIIGIIIIWWVVTVFLSIFMGLGITTMVIAVIIVISGISILNGLPTDEK